MNNYLYTMSSNATPKYVVNILEGASLPWGFVNHFRYQLQWIDNELRSVLPQKGEGKNPLKNIRAVTSYLYQEKKDGNWEWIDIYPMRIGTVMDAYKTGNEDTDVAHFYIRMENYISYYKGQKFIRILEDVEKKKYAYLGKPLDNKYVAYKQNSKSSFHRICESLNLDHFKSPGGEVLYKPLFFIIDGIKDKKGKFLLPKYDSISFKSFYKLKEGSRYSFEFAFYFSEKPPEFLIKLLSDERIFSTPPVYELKASSRYDEESWAIVSSLLERDTWTSISFKTELPDKVDDKESLNIHLNFPVKIKRKILYRTIDVLSDIGFGIGTGSIALSKMIEKWTWWYWPVIIGYIVWAVCKLIIKLWRG